MPKMKTPKSTAKRFKVTGTGELLAQYAKEQIADRDFRRERALPNGWTLNSKEELMYYRIFKNSVKVKSGEKGEKEGFGGRFEAV